MKRKRERERHVRREGERDEKKVRDYKKKENGTKGKIGKCTSVTVVMFCGLFQIDQNL